MAAAVRKKKPAKTEPVAEVAPAVVAEPTVTSIKGFDSKLQCRNFQFELGKTYEVTGKIGACSNGFHACPADEHPLSVFEYYPPTGARYAEVMQSGATDKSGNKLASAKITIGVELSIGDLVARAVKWVFDRSKPEGENATGYSGAASATGDSGAASATGDSGAAMASGYAGRVMGAKGCALFAVERDDDWNIINVACGIVGKDELRADVWYVARAGKLVEA